MRWLCCLVSLASVANLVAAPGSVKTLDGRSISGDLRLTNGFLLVLSTNTEPARFAIADLLAVNFNERSATTGNTAGLGNGLLGHYFGNTNLEGPVFIRLDESIDFDWSIGEPAPGVGIDYFSVAWTGEVEAPATGEYIFTIAADEGAQLFLDGKAIVDTAPRRDGREVGSAPTRLEAGTKHPLKLVYSN